MRNLGLFSVALRFGARFCGELLDAVYPPLCPLCKAPSRVDSRTGACETHEIAEILPGNRCGRCLARISDALPRGEACAGCRLEPPSYRAALALGDYREDEGLREWILALKHGGRKDLAETLGALLGEKLGLELGPKRARGTLLVPVPLHPLRLFERGYDQAVLLARAAARSSGAAVGRFLRRIRWTPPQGAIGAPPRPRNVQGAFAPAHGGLELHGLALWLVDDVLTSGSTVEECARVLLREGASSVSVLCIARAGVDGRAEQPAI